MALPSDWYFGGAPRLRDVYGGFNVGDIQPQQPQAPTTAATPPAPSARLALSPAGGFKNTFADGQVPDGNMPGGSFGGAPTGPAAPGGPGPIGNTAEAFSAFPGMSPIDASQAAQAQNTSDVNAMNALANPVGSLFGATGLMGAGVGLGAQQALGAISPALSAVAGPAQAVFGVPAAAQAIGTAFGAPTATVGNRSLASDQNDLNSAFSTINPFAEPAGATPAISSTNAFDAPTGTPGTSGVNSAGQSVGFGAPGTAGSGVAGGFSSSFGGSGAGGAVGGTNFGGVGNNTAGLFSGIEGQAPGPAPDSAPAPGDSAANAVTEGNAGGAPGPGPGPGDAGPTGGDSGGGTAGGDEKRGGLIGGKRAFGQRPDPKMLAAKLQAGGGVVTQGKQANVDSVPVRLARNEFVVNRAATRAHLAELERINASAGQRQGGMGVRAPKGR